MHLGRGSAAEGGAAGVAVAEGGGTVAPEAASATVCSGTVALGGRITPLSSVVCKPQNMLLALPTCERSK